MINQNLFLFNQLCVCGFLNDNPHRLRRLATMKSRFTITCLAAHFTRIAAGDCRDGVLFYTYQKVCFYCDIKVPNLVSA